MKKKTAQFIGPFSWVQNRVKLWEVKKRAAITIAET